MRGDVTAAKIRAAAVQVFTQLEWEPDFVPDKLAPNFFSFHLFFLVNVGGDVFT